MKYRQCLIATVQANAIFKPLATTEQNSMSNPFASASLDTIINLNPNGLFSHLNEFSITRSELLSHAWHISQQLPDKVHAINLCSNRYLFIVSYLAVIIRKQINLLPANRAQNTINDLLDNYPESYYIVNNADRFNGSRYQINAQTLRPTTTQPVSIEPDQVVSISFTSGTTGRAKAIPKTWQEFQQSAQLATHRLDLKRQNHSIISTVPPQHMYGLETSLYWPLIANLTIANCHPLFPEDIRQAVSSTMMPCLLVSTPAHLKACVRAELNWENIAMVLSSTASMDSQLAKQIESCFQAPLFEIFGSTETLSFASRRPNTNEHWQPYQDISVFSKHNEHYVQGGHLQKTHQLDDILAIDQQGCFTITGRATDIVKIAGKRASLAELNRILNQIEGVEDGLFFRGNGERLSVLVVSTLSKKAIITELKTSIDEVFLPRPIHRVNQIPRNRVGKIVKEKLEQLIRTN